MSKRQFHQRLLNRYSIRLHFTGIILSLLLFGMALSRVLLNYGVESLPQRSAIVIAASYGFFFLLVKLWLNYLISESPPELEITEKDLQEDELESSPKASMTEKRSGKWNIWDGLVPDSEILFILIALILLLGFFYWLAAEGPFLLCDAAFEVALSATLLRVSRKALRQGDCVWHLFKRTILWFLFIWILGMSVTYIVSSYCPNQNRLSAVVKECWKN